MRAGNEPVNRFKNRSQEALPYDHSRVVLINSQNSDYINASYIAGADSPCEYIATQGPLYSTLSDFWRMVYEHRTGVIVMLCDSVENGKKMVDPYWPDEINVPVRHGELTVTMTGVSVLDAYAMRQIKVTMKDRQDLRVTQLCIRGWSERGCSLPAEKLIDVIRVAGSRGNEIERTCHSIHCILSRPWQDWHWFIALRFF
ncbi:tyrosine-protein phosphatase non-receptor type 18-like [Pomacea canaliculata]|uniref:tyrosine-protein phosphatase non-receptor type 18-like n=1 Tax=Pomacea canaliculata TaxID=400727 RepID=UPI000D7313A6|nr:tyrosine-protein phosphatase non-receptor type 18-like [Pomacea canaliculata]